MTYQVFLAFLLHGMLSPTPLFLFVFTILTSLLTLLAVSCYLHRSQTHRSVDFVAPVNYIFRFTLWLFTGMKTIEWVSIHRKHHAMCDTETDPHSPRYFGLKKILLEGADIYKKAGTNNPELLSEYGEGTPNDWFERLFYNNRMRSVGVGLTLVIELVLFGLPALIIWPIQMLVIPIIAAGFINGVAHVWGTQRYKDGEPRKEGGVYQGNYKFSHAWYEFDLAGTLIELLMFIGFAWVPRRER